MIFIGANDADDVRRALHVGDVERLLVTLHRARVVQARRVSQRSIDFVSALCLPHIFHFQFCPHHDISHVDLTDSPLFKHLDLNLVLYIMKV